MKKQSQIESVIANEVKQSLKMKLKSNRLLRHSSLIPCNNKLKKLLFLFAILFSINNFSQEIKYKEYSYSQFLKMIQTSTDSIFELNDALIKPNFTTDQDFIIKDSEEANLDSNKSRITIDKEIKLNNVQFFIAVIDDKTRNSAVFFGLKNITFKNTVVISQCFSISFFNSKFKKRFDFANWELSKDIALQLERIDIRFRYNSFYDDAWIQCIGNLELQGSFFDFRNNNLLGQNEKGVVKIRSRAMSDALIEVNNFGSLGWNHISLEENENLSVERNTFTNGIAVLTSREDKELFFKDNDIQTETLLDLNVYNNLAEIGLDQFQKPISSVNGYWKFTWEKKIPYTNRNFDSILQAYKNEYRIQNKISFNYEVEQLSEFYSFYKNKFNTDEANKYYVDIKDIETQRLAYLYSNNPNFKTYFTWKTNQFLKLFSAYGTEPARAIIYSMYVILIFALVYLFFPNSWDSHGKNRIIDRYNFFFKYMKLKTGVHEVYLDDQKEELMSYEQFKENITTSKQKVPKFFTATALPLYKWAISGTQFSASILKRIDIMKGTWSELPQSKRIWKAILLIGAFLLAIIYDIFIKILNALMLSINTFTTLGFGEIPIKGLPRYLAIIQGFIGWFMLTIFSVSLISQLLN